MVHHPGEGHADPTLGDHRIGDETFFDAIMKPHTCYYGAIKPLFANPGMTGLAHITGGGVPGNLNRIIPQGLSAKIDLGLFRILPVFSFIKQQGKISDDDMLRTFNLGVGLVMVLREAEASQIVSQLASTGITAYRIGTIQRGNKEVDCHGSLLF